MSEVVTSANSALMFLPLDQIEANEFALRSVDVENPDVLALFDNIAARGVQKPIGVRPSKLNDKKTPKLTPDGRPMYSVKDGLHRFTGACRAKLAEVPVIVKDEDDRQVEMSQIMDNFHNIPTKHYEYGKALKNILSHDTTVTSSELANKLNVSVAFLEARMGLGGLHKDGVDSKGEPTSTIGDLVDKGSICLGNAVALAKLKPTEEQLSFVDDAVKMPTLQFTKKIQDRIKALRTAKMAGKEAAPDVGFSPNAHFRKKPLVEAEAQRPTELPILLKAKGYNVDSEAVKFILNWTLHLDEQSLVVAKAEWDAAEKARVIKLADAKLERAKKAQAEAETAQKAAAAAAAIK